MKRLTTRRGAYVLGTVALVASPTAAFASSGGGWHASSSAGTGTAKAISIAISGASGTKTTCIGTGNHVDVVSVNWSGNALTGESYNIAATTTNPSGKVASATGTLTSSQPPVSINLQGKNTNSAITYTVTVTVSLGSHWSSSSAFTYNTAC